MEELEEAKQQAQTATHAFNAVRQARYDTFTKAFNHISAGIDQIFKVSSLAGVRAIILALPQAFSMPLSHFRQHLMVVSLDRTCLPRNSATVFVLLQQWVTHGVRQG